MVEGCEGITYATRECFGQMTSRHESIKPTSMTSHGKLISPRKGDVSGLVLSARWLVPLLAMLLTLLTTRTDSIVCGGLVDVTTRDNGECEA